MKSVIIASAAAALAISAAPAMAQTFNPSSVYINLGDSYVGPGSVHGLDEITGRMGARFGPYWGVEGEIGGGVANSNIPGGHVSETVAGAGYAVGYVPLTPRFDFLARVGYGDSSFHSSSAVPGVSNTRLWGSVNYGVGGQYMLTANDGVRADFTVRDYQGSGSPSSADVWGASWVHKF